MAEKDKVFYWIKLKKEFMEGEVVDFLMSQKNGAQYVVLYQMLIMKTINTKGKLCSEIGEVIIPFDCDKIQRDCKWFDIDTVRVALELYGRLGLVYLNKDGILQIANFKEVVGSETYWAKQKRLKRIEKEDNESVGQIPTEVQHSLISNISKSNISQSNDIDNSSNKEEYNIEFETLWEMYPNKQGKKNALKSYIKARKNGTTFEEVKQGIESYCKQIKAKQTEKEYIKHGSTWFNQEGWTDEYDFTPKGSTASQPAKQETELKWGGNGIL